VIAGYFGFPVGTGDNTRRNFILLAMGIYFFKSVISQFIFMDREYRWSEALTSSLWLFIAYNTFVFTAGTIKYSPGRTEISGIIILLIGVLISLVSEYQRINWLSNPETSGKLYKGGLFRLSRHINYFGELIIFTGFAMITKSVWAYTIPLTLIIVFAMVNIPMQDKKLKEKFGDEFESYASHSKKMIPFLY
jgi:steroid 5-alpha reductase family enzyme